LTGVLGMKFKGFMMQARVVKSSTIVGSWIFTSLEHNELLDDDSIATLKCSSDNVYKSFYIDYYYDFKIY
jgi:hypothetical protein